MIIPRRLYASANSGVYVIALVKSLIAKSSCFIKEYADPRVTNATYCPGCFNNNRLNKGIISTVQSQTKLDLPSYYNPVSQQCDDSNNVFTVKSAPRQLTQAQLYTINTIYQDRQTQKTRPNAPTSNNVLAVIPIPNATAYGDNIVLFGSDMSTNSRDYFGPVTIERIKTSILDDKGNLVDLNGADWSFTFRIKQLYQY